MDEALQAKIQQLHLELCEFEKTHPHLGITLRREYIPELKQAEMHVLVSQVIV